MPPVHGILRPTCVHPAAYTFKLPDSVSDDAGAMVEPLAVGVLASGAIDVRPLITDHFAFADSIEAFDYAKAMKPTSVKVQIKMPD